MAKTPHKDTTLQKYPIIIVAMLTIPILLCAVVFSTATGGIIQEKSNVQIPGTDMGEDSKMTEMEAGEGGQMGVSEQESEDLSWEGVKDLSQTASRAVCYAGWSRYGSRCFRFFNSPSTWANAERHCLAYGANLASVHSTAEYHFLQNMVVRGTGVLTRTWLGGSDAVHNRMWFWSDGSGFDYQNWNPEEPNNHRGREPCIVMNWDDEARWNDWPCGHTHPFICVLKSV